MRSSSSSSAPYPGQFDTRSRLIIGCVALAAFVIATVLQLRQSPKPTLRYALLATSGQKSKSAVPAAPPPPPASSSEFLEALKTNDKVRMEAEIQSLVRRGVDPFTRRVDLYKEWQLVCTETDAAVVSLGSGKPLESGLRLMDAFLVITKNTMEWQQAVRRLGPWPNELYVFKGEWSFRRPRDIAIEWTRFEVANGSRATDGLRKFDVQLAYIDDTIMILKLEPGVLVFKAVEDRQAQLDGLRIKRPGSKPNNNPLTMVTKLFRRN